VTAPGKHGGESAGADSLRLRDHRQLRDHDLLGQAYLPSRVGLASGITLGLAIGLGGVAATALGVVADQAGLEAVLWVIALLPVPALLLSISLPTEDRRRLVVQDQRR
jgi:hypothetical protein